MKPYYCRSSFPNFLLIFTSLAVLTFFQTNLYAATFTVTNTNNSGGGRLRQAIIAAAADGVDTIAFNIHGGGVKKIIPMAALLNRAAPDQNSTEEIGPWRPDPNTLDKRRP